ncbi:4-hydroxy-tetrahydrodipicolinate reductase [Eubacteriales bacterium OttesenSCG-928-K08]|nr:4-hydroxy-tetrahydrodipicolinate reductase [Eubacteriales bacterium OttesenSCG-928-K08]
MIKLIINGACGQMGRTIIRLAKSMPEEYLVIAGVDPCGIEESEGVPVAKTIDEVPQDADVVIDFSRPSSLPQVLSCCQRRGLSLVLGTTGLAEADKRLLERMSATVPIFHSGNMSLGVNLQIELLKSAAAALGAAYEPEITEKHHHLKVDSPSGTALMLADAINSQFPIEREYVYGRHTKDKRRTANEIGIHSIRGGTVVGEHCVEFFGQDEVIGIFHKAYSKQVFATGALRAAKYMIGKLPGLYNMHDIVTEKEVLSHIYTQDDQAIISLSSLARGQGALSSIFGAIAAENVFVDMISVTSPGGGFSDISFSLPRNQLATALNALKGLRQRFPGMDVHAMDNITKLTVEGPGMAIRHGVASELFAVLCEADVSIELVTTSETKIALCIKNSDVSNALMVITKQFSI